MAQQEFDIVYHTHTGLVLHYQYEDDVGLLRVYLKGDRRESPLYVGPDHVEAQEIFERVKAHYESRRAKEEPGATVPA